MYYKWNRISRKTNLFRLFPIILEKNVLLQIHKQIFLTTFLTKSNITEINYDNYLVSKFSCLYK